MLLKQCKRRWFGRLVPVHSGLAIDKSQPLALRIMQDQVCSRHALYRIVGESSAHWSFICMQIQEFVGG